MFAEGGGFRCFIGWHDFWIIDKNVRECSRCKCYQVRTQCGASDTWRWQWVLKQ